jgi:hypothetical protein
MTTWFDIKRAAIKINHDRKTNGRSVDQMLEDVRQVIVQTGYSVSGPSPTTTGGCEFRTKDGLKLEYQTNEWTS